MLASDDERRRTHPPDDPETGGDSPGQRRFPGAERPVEQHQVTGAQALRERAAERLGVRLGRQFRGSRGLISHGAGPDPAPVASSRPAWTVWRARPAGQARRRSISGCSSCTRCPAPPTITSSDFGSAAAIASECSTGVIRSRSPHAISVGTLASVRQAVVLVVHLQRVQELHQRRDRRAVHHLLGERHHARADLLVAVGRRPQHRGDHRLAPLRGCGAPSWARTGRRTGPPPAQGSAGSRPAATVQLLRPPTRSAPRRRCGCG